MPNDRAVRDGRVYSDKAPALSFAALPIVGAVRAAERLTGTRIPLVWESPARLWLVRSILVGLALLALVLLLGRVSEGLVPGSGAIVAVAAGLGTILGPLASILFAHVPAACLCFGAFVVAARSIGTRGLLLAGGLAGVAVLVEYQAVLVAVLLTAYVAATRGPRAVAAFVVGALPAAAALGIYDQLAFGAPWHLSYDYVDGPFAAKQDAGFFGIGAPRLSSLASTLFGDRGLLVVAPVLAAAAGGLVIARRRMPMEALLACAVVALFLLLQSGYFLVYGGYSPGPRFFAPALPFLLLGLPAALARWPRVVRALVALSVALGTANALTWRGFGDGVPFDPELPATLASLAGAPRGVGVAIVIAAATAALLLVARGPAVASPPLR